ncbi:PEP-CTERM sorting domain-containing protein [Spirulina subsalsa]|uniref:PEP-CTERM sorting domain-containing protein n=1 Tax=Spirulina subsalsa TaxID=54311 RepID=UPI0002D78F63|nr:PEP-CTERM sorting domain-containing protein [Spirulina subsalsa]
MKLNSTALISSLAAAGAIAATGMPAQAASFTASDAAGCAGLTSCVVNDFFTLTAGDGKYLTYKEFALVDGVGVSATEDIKKDPSWGEIDSNGERLIVDFAKATALRSIDLSFLYKDGVNSDRVNEVAKVTATLLDGSLVTHTLSVLGDTLAGWSGNYDGTAVKNMSPSIAFDGVNHAGGWYSILNPFGDLEVASLEFTAVRLNDSLARQSWDSDYALKGIKTVPEPATVLGLMGVATLAGFTARRRRVDS